MAKVITLSRKFPSYHPKAGQPTNFVGSVWNSIYQDRIPDVIHSTFTSLPEDFLDWSFIGNELIKHHTIRLGRRWKDGDMASLRVWSGKPYRSPQIKIAEDVKLRVVDITIDFNRNVICVHKRIDYESYWSVNHVNYYVNRLAENDGLTVSDMIDWFKFGKKKGEQEAQILIWGDVKEY